LFPWPKSVILGFLSSITGPRLLDGPSPRLFSLPGQSSIVKPGKRRKTGPFAHVPVFAAGFGKSEITAENFILTFTGC